MPRLVVEANYAGTTGHKLFRAENVNRIPGGRAAGRRLRNRQFWQSSSAGRWMPTNPLGRLNPNFGTLRVWENVVELQLQLAATVDEEAGHSRHDFQRQLHL